MIIANQLRRYAAWLRGEEDAPYIEPPEEVRRMLSDAADRLERLEEATKDVIFLTKSIKNQREFSRETFGPGPRTEALIDHIRKELDEIASEPHDLTEWIDVMILAMDGAWRAGYEPEQIVKALAQKQAENQKRTWPDWRTADPGKAIEHVREEK